MVVGTLRDPEKCLKDWEADGEVLYRMMTATSEEEAIKIHRTVRDLVDWLQEQAAVTRWRTLEDNGWVRTRLLRPDPEKLVKYASAARQLTIHDDYRRYNLRHRFKHTGHTRAQRSPGTNAEAIFSFNHEDRGIIIEHAEAPEYLVATKDDRCSADARLPEQTLRASDLMFLGWDYTSSSHHNPMQKEYDPKSLEWVLVDSIREPYTQNLLYKMFEEREVRPPVAGAFDYMLNYRILPTDFGFGQTLLACPIGRIVSWFLIQHKETLGNKKVSDVVVFSDDNVDTLHAEMQMRRTPSGEAYVTPRRPMHMLFFIEDVAVDGEEEGYDGEGEKDDEDETENQSVHEEVSGAMKAMKI